MRASEHPTNNYSFKSWQHRVFSMNHRHHTMHPPLMVKIKAWRVVMWRWGHHHRHQQQQQQYRPLPHRHHPSSRHHRYRLLLEGGLVPDGSLLSPLLPTYTSWKNDRKWRHCTRKQRSTESIYCSSNYGAKWTGPLAHRMSNNPLL